MDSQFDVGGFAPDSATADVRITRNVRNAEDDAGTQFEVLYAYGLFGIWMLFSNSENLLRHQWPKLTGEINEIMAQTMSSWEQYTYQQRKTVFLAVHALYPAIQWQYQVPFSGFIYKIPHIAETY